jgi:hypothetical protein
MTSRNFTPDQVLIDRLIGNDTAAFEELYRRYWYSLYIYSVKKLYSPEDARMIVRDLFIQLWEKRHTWPIDFSISQHLYTEVRKSVVENLNAKLNIVAVNSMLGQEIEHGFSVQALQQAKLPVKLTVPVKPRGVVITKEQWQQPAPRHSITLAHLKWLFQAVTAKLL